MKTFDDGPGRLVAKLADDLQYPVLAEQFRRGRLGIPDPVGYQENQVARIERQGCQGRVAGIGQDSKRKSDALQMSLDVPGGVEHVAGRMPGAAVRKTSRRGVQSPEEERDETVVLGFLDQNPVRGSGCAGIAAGFRKQPQRGMDRCHEQGGGEAVPRDVADGHAQRSVLQEKVVERVAAGELGRIEAPATSNPGSWGGSFGKRCS